MNYKSLVMLSGLLLLIPACRFFNSCNSRCCPSTTCPTVESSTVVTQEATPVVPATQAAQDQDKEALEEAELVDVMTDK